MFFGIATEKTSLRFACAAFLHSFPVKHTTPSGGRSLVLHGCQVCQISLWQLKALFTIWGCALMLCMHLSCFTTLPSMSTQSTVRNLGCALTQLPSIQITTMSIAHSNAKDIRRSILTNLTKYPIKSLKRTKKQKDLNSKPNSSASSPWRRLLSVPDHHISQHWHRPQPPEAQAPRRHGRLSLPSGGVSHLGEPRRSSVGRLRRLFWRRSGSLGILAVVAGSKGWSKEEKWYCD